VFFAEALPPDELLRSLAKLRAYHQSRLEAYRAFKRDVDKKSGSYQALRLGISYQELMLEWIDSLPAYVKKAQKAPRKGRPR
jgi:hypothetical protein